MRCNGCGRVGAEYCDLCRQYYCRQCFAYHNRRGYFLWYSGKVKGFRAKLAAVAVTTAIFLFFTGADAQKFSTPVEQMANDSSFSSEKCMREAAPFLSYREKANFEEDLNFLQRKSLLAAKHAKEAKRRGEAEEYLRFSRRAEDFLRMRLDLQREIARLVEERRRREERKRRKLEGERLQEELYRFKLRG